MGSNLALMLAYECGNDILDGRDLGNIRLRSLSFEAMKESSVNTMYSVPPLAVAVSLSAFISTRLPSSNGQALNHRGMRLSQPS